MPQRVFEVLLVEDNPGDVYLIQEALAEGPARKQIRVARDGAEAAALVEERASRPPDLVLLDLNLPKRSGHQVLADIRRHGGWKRTPVVVFTSSSAASDVLEAYERGANCYVTKPQGLEELTGVIRSIESFWLIVAVLPGRTCCE